MRGSRKGCYGQETNPRLKPLSWRIPVAGGDERPFSGRGGTEQGDGSIEPCSGSSVQWGPKVFMVRDKSDGTFESPSVEGKAPLKPRAVSGSIVVMRAVKAVGAKGPSRGGILDGTPYEGKLSRTVWGGGKPEDDVKGLPITMLNQASLR